MGSGGCWAEKRGSRQCGAALQRLHGQVSCSSQASRKHAQAQTCTCPPRLRPQLLERREKEAAGTDAHARNDRLRYGARLYRLLGAVLLAATPLVPLPPAAATAGPALASAVEQLRRLAHRMAMLAVGSSLAVHCEFVAQRAARAAAGRGGLAALDVEDDLGSELLSLGDVRQRLQVGG